MKTLILNFKNIKVEFRYKVLYVKYDGNYQLTIQDKREGIYHLFHFLNDVGLVFNVEVAEGDSVEHIINVRCTSFLSYRNGIAIFEFNLNK